MPNFNRGDVLSLTLDYDDVVTITGNASVKITPLGGTTSYTTVTGTQTLGSYKNTSTALSITCDTAGSYTTSNDPSVNAHLLINAAGTGGQNAITGADVSLGGGGGTFQTLTDAASILTVIASSSNFKVTLGGNRALANPTGNLVEGTTYFWRIQQDATGSRTLSFGSMFKFAGGVAPTLTTAANAVDIISAKYDGTNLLCANALNIA